MEINLIILAVLVCSALWTVMARSLLRSGIALAFTSAVLSIIIFRLNSPLAAVFELSVCAGLISVLFVSTISLTTPLTHKEVLKHMKARLSRFWYLPLILAAAAILLSRIKIDLNLNLPAAETENDARYCLWHLRQVDLMGQIIILLAGAFAVVILFREARKNGR